MANTPEEYNLLTNVQFKLEIVNFPNLTYFCQDVILPSMQIDSPVFNVPRAQGVPMPGSQVNFDPLNVTFLVDEELNNYYEMYKWIMDIQRTEDRGIQKRDGVLHFLTGQMNLQRYIRFVGLVPTFISELNLSSTDSDVDGIQATVNFAFEYFDFPAKDERVGSDNPLLIEDLEE